MMAILCLGGARVKSKAEGPVLKFTKNSWPFAEFVKTRHYESGGHWPQLRGFVLVRTPSPCF